MSKNMTRKGLAFGTGLALLATGLVSTPSVAAVGDVLLAPSAGSKYGTFISDAFSLSASVSSQVVNSKLAYRIDNADQLDLVVELFRDVNNDGVADSGEDIDKVRLAGISDKGVYAALNSGNLFAINGTNTNGSFLVDFVDLGITSLVIYDLTWTNSDPADVAGALPNNIIRITPVEGAANGGTAITADLHDLLNADVVDELDYSDGDVVVDVTAWVEAEAVADYETVDAAYASPKRSVTWFDPEGVAAVPSIERVITSGATRLNDVGNALTAAIRFNKDINLAQFDKSMWTEQVTTTGLPAFANDSDVHGTALIAVGLGSNADRMDRYVFDPSSHANVAADTTYTLNVHSKLAETAGVTRWFSSTGYSISAGTTVATTVVRPVITDTTDVDFTQVAATSGADNFATANVRAGVKSVTYTTQLQTGATPADVKTASVPMLAIVRSDAFLPTGSSFTVAGNASPITRGSEARIVTGFSNADGQFTVTVNSAVAARNESYSVDVYALVNGVFTRAVAERGTGGTAGGSDVSRITSTYASATAGSTSLTAVNSVVAGADVTVAFEVTDQFGKAISKTATGRQLYISLVAPNEDNLDLNATVPESGEVKFTFKNYLAVGGSDLLTATLYTGSASDPTTVDTAVVTLYNTGATGAVQVPTTLNGVITYRDFIANGAKVVAGVTVDPDNDIVFTGTVVDANGVGIPAAVVTINAPGMQIQDGDRYYVGTRTTNANAAGVFTVNLNAQKVNTTGTTVTVTTADGKTASTLVRTYFPEDGDPFTAGTQPLNANVLDFKLSIPANVVVNQTYAVTATLKDKWGNPVRTSSATNAVEFLGVGSVQINGTSNTVSRQFDANGEALVYVRSVKDIAGPGTITASLALGHYTYWDAAAGATATKAIAITPVTTNVTSTAWDETKFVNSFSNVVEVLHSAPVTGKVNVGSFNGKLVVYASGLNGARISWKVGGNWGSAVATSNYSIFNRPTPRAGVTVSVEVFVNGVKQLTKSVVTR